MIVVCDSSRNTLGSPSSRRGNTVWSRSLKTRVWCLTSPLRVVRGHSRNRLHTCRAHEDSDDDMGRIVRVALPALVVVVSDPLQTLVDSACLGQFSTVHLAAIGPNTAIFNSLFQLFTFLGVTTANAVAESGGTEEDKKEASSTVRTALVLACLCGFGVMGGLHYMGNAILDMMGTDVRVMPHAMDYMMVRAKGIPCVLVMNVFQGLCLGLQDTRIPMVVCGIATLLNIIGDIILVSAYDMGARGAAIATVCAQTVGLVLMIYLLKKKEHVSGREIIFNDTKGSWRKFVTVGVALIARTAAGMAAYFAMATSAMGMGIVAAAAHQVAMQMFWFISYLPEPLSMAAQTLVAKEYSRNPGAAKKWAQRLVATGAIFGMALSIVALATLTWGAVLFSSDRIIQHTVQSLAPLGGSAIAICSVLMMFDGISIGSRAFAHLPIGVAAGLIVVLGILYLGAPMGLTSVWWALNGFYATRLFVHIYHYFISRIFYPDSTTVFSISPL